MSFHRVLSTRSIDPALISAAEKHGVQIFVREMITVHLIANADIAAKVNSIGNDIVVFTSSNAVKAVKQMLSVQTNPSSWKIYALAGATSSAVNNLLNTDAEITNAADAADLSIFILKQESPQKIIFFCGNRKREVLPDSLRKAGFDVQEVEVYETGLTKTAVHEPFDGILFFSPSAVQSFFASNKLSEEVVCFCIGKTTAAALKDFTHNKILIAHEPSEKSIVQLVTNIENYTT